MLLWNFQIVDLPDPARQFVEIIEPWSPDGRDSLPLLPGKPDLASHHGARERAGRNNQNEVLKLFGFQRGFDLRPPILPTLERNEILPDRKALGFELLAELIRASLPILGGIGNEDTLVTGHGLSTMGS
jgi:hypothetical protein